MGYILNNMVPVKMENVPPTIRSTVGLTMINLDIEIIKITLPGFSDKRCFALFDPTDGEYYYVIPTFQVGNDCYSFNCIADLLWEALDFVGVLYAKHRYRGRKLRVKDAVRALYIHNVIRGHSEADNYQEIIKMLGDAFPQLDSEEAVKKLLDESRKEDITNSYPVIDIYGEKITTYQLSHLFVCGGKTSLVGKYLTFRIYSPDDDPMELAKMVSRKDPKGLLETVETYTRH